jgi:hypothetical protein
MPFTPFHLGVGAVCKAGLGERFSFMVFGGSQVLMDLEPGIKLIIGTAPLHGPSHTLAGAVVIGLVATLIGKPVSEFALRLIGYPDSRISWAASGAAAFAGTLSHIGLDAIMHADMHPWAPIAQSNGLLGLITMRTLHWACVMLGVLGALGIWVRYAKRTERPGTAR